LRRRWIIGLTIVLVVVIGVPAYVFLTPPEQSYLDQAIRKSRFYPITPPTTLRAPGTIYVVASDGQPISALCEVNAARLKDFIQESLTETQVAQALRKASIAADAVVEQNLRARLKADIIESVNLSLEDVSVLEVSIANLRTLATEMQNDAACADSILEYLNAGENVCQGQQVLKATTKYLIQTKRAADGQASTQELKAAVRATIDPNANFDGSTAKAGVGLYYGMRLAPRCMALKGEKIKRAPVSWLDRLLNMLSL
jgi:hypothetical protein